MCYLIQYFLKKQKIQLYITLYFIFERFLKNQSLITLIEKIKSFIFSWMSCYAMILLTLIFKTGFA